MPTLLPAKIAQRELLKAVIRRSQNSPDPRTHIACGVATIFGDNDSQFTLFSDVNRPINESCYDYYNEQVENLSLPSLKKQLKHDLFEHAERITVMRYMTHFDVSNMKDKLLVVPWGACCDCARIIALSGCQSVLVSDVCVSLLHGRVAETTDIGFMILRSAGVQITTYYGTLDERVFFDGEHIDV